MAGPPNRVASSRPSSLSASAEEQLAERRRIHAKRKAEEDLRGSIPGGATVSSEASTSTCQGTIKRDKKGKGRESDSDGVSRNDDHASLDVASAALEETNDTAEQTTLDLDMLLDGLGMLEL
jgi:hypothetical protein